MGDCGLKWTNPNLQSSEYQTKRLNIKKLLRSVSSRRRKTSHLLLFDTSFHPETFNALLQLGILTYMSKFVLVAMFLTTPRRFSVCRDSTITEIYRWQFCKILRLWQWPQGTYIKLLHINFCPRDAIRLPSLNGKVSLLGPTDRSSAWCLGSGPHRAINSTI